MEEIREPQLPTDRLTAKDYEAMDDKYFQGILDNLEYRKANDLKPGIYESKSSTVRISHLVNYIKSRQSTKNNPIENKMIAEELTRMFLYFDVSVLFCLQT